MNDFTETEKEILARIDQVRLRRSLAALRQVMENIWSSEAPRIVHDFTDHGEQHSVRVAGFANRILEARTGRDLSAEEAYLLLAGIYLHDIGMQCDVVRFPEIKKRASTFGARFDIEFTTRTSSTFSNEEQKAIRSNHHYLTAGWLDHAFRTEETPIGPACRTVPNHLRSDLIDICKFHARLPISDCPVVARSDRTRRPQLVAAILRFADELDVSVERVSIETIQIFTYDPENSMYWWLHHQTSVVFSAANVIVLNIRLHPRDMSEHGEFIRSTFVDRFHEKNRSVLDVLAQNGIPLAISAESSVVEDEHATPLPPEILQMMRAMKQGQVRGARAQAQPGTSIPQTMNTRGYVLVVEDDLNWQDLLEKLLENSGYPHKVIDNYSEALRAIIEADAWFSEAEPALCVTDLRLASMTVDDNLDALGLLAECLLREMPAIVVSAFVKPRIERLLYRDYGVLACFDKATFDEEEFLRMVSRQLDTPAR